MTIPYLHKINLTKNDLSVKEATKLLKINHLYYLIVLVILLINKQGFFDKYY